MSSQVREREQQDSHEREVPSESQSQSQRQRQSSWLLLAIASGSCAAINGVFAKLTTTSLTSNWSHNLSTFLSLTSPTSLNIIEYLLRAAFFGLNLLFNLAMWSLFTAALTRAFSATRVGIVNVSANFAATALLGLVIFGEKLPLMWWVGAAILAVGNVVIGARREEGAEDGKMKEWHAGDNMGEGRHVERRRKPQGEEEHAEEISLMEGLGRDGDDSPIEQGREEDDDIIDLDVDDERK